MRIVDNWIHSDEVEISRTPNIGGKFKHGQPDTIVIHFTGGSSATSSVRHLSNRSTKASAHLVIGRKGEVFQLAPFDTVTWHAGRSTWKGRHGLNQFSIGIELDNAGELKDNGNGMFLSWFNKAFSKEEVYSGIHRNRSEPSFWHAYTEPQIEKVFEVCRMLVDQYKIKEIVGHEEIAPNRKSDPGPAFPLDRLREQILTENRSEDHSAEPSGFLQKEAIVDTAKLNIRTGPGVDYGMVSPPLLKGTVVNPLRQQGGWTEVELTTRGWVSSQYIKSIG